MFILIKCTVDIRLISKELYIKKKKELASKRDFDDFLKYVVKCVVMCLLLQEGLSVIQTLFNLSITEYFKGNSILHIKVCFQVLGSTTRCEQKSFTHVVALERAVQNQFKKFKT